MDWTTQHCITEKSQKDSNMYNVYVYMCVYAFMCTNHSVYDIKIISYVCSLYVLIEMCANSQQQHTATLL